MSISKTIPILTLMALIGGCWGDACSVQAGDREYDRRHRRVFYNAGSGAITDAGSPPDTGTCPPTCDPLTNQFALSFDGVDDRIVSVSTSFTPTHPGIVTCCYLGTNPSWSTSTAEEVFSKYDGTPKTGFFYQQGGANQQAAGAPGANGSPTELMRTDSGVVTSPVGTCVHWDMRQASNASKMAIWWNGADAGTAMGSVGNKVSVGATSGTEIRTNSLPFSIGARYVADGGSSVPFSGKIAEFICFDGDLTEAQMNALFTYDGGVRMEDPRSLDTWDMCMFWLSMGENGVDGIADGGLVVTDRCGANDFVAFGTNDGGPTRVSWP